MYGSVAYVLFAVGCPHIPRATHRNHNIKLLFICNIFINYVFIILPQFYNTHVELSIVLIYTHILYSILSDSNTLTLSKYLQHNFINSL